MPLQTILNKLMNKGRVIVKARRHNPVVIAAGKLGLRVASKALSGDRFYMEIV